MTRLNKLVLTALAAVVALSLAAGPAAARSRIEASTTAVLNSGRLTFNSNIAQAICDVTLHATMRRLITKIAGEPVGDITAILTANARNSIGAAAACSGLAPMRIAYGSIRGTLPTITGGELRVTGAFLVRIGNAGCLYTGTIGNISNENPIRTGTIEREPRQRLFRALEEEFFRRCPAEGELLGELTFTPSVTLRLLER
jgi:hypothetical protein